MQRPQSTPSDSVDAIRSDVTDSLRTPFKVLYCESNIDGTVGGSHYCLLYLLESLDRGQYEPIVIFQQAHTLVSRFQAVAEIVLTDPPSPTRWGTGPVARRLAAIRLPLALARRAVNAAKLVARTVGHVAYLRRRGIALVHLNNSITRSHDWIAAALLAGIPCVVHERGLPEYTWLDRALARRLALIVPVSKWVERHMIERGVSPTNIRTMYDGLDPAGLRVLRTPEALRTEWRIGPNQPVIGIVGNVREWKGQETVVRALIEIVQVRPDVVCLFVGAATPSDRAYQDKLNAMIARAGIEPNVRFTGYQTDVPSFINLMQFVIHASVSPEPFGMVVLESMALKRAVVGSRAGGVIEMVAEGDTGYTFPPGDASALAAHAIELLRDPEKATQMGLRGYQRVSTHFTLTRYMHEIHDAYRALIERRSLPPHTEPARVNTH